MPSLSFFMGVGSIFISSFSTPVSAQSVYSLAESYSGDSFFDNFNFFSKKDPTNGFVHYLDESTARNDKLVEIRNGQAYMGVDSQSKLDHAAAGRKSVRIESKKTYTQGLFVVDLAHMPEAACGSWPAFWSVGSDWPADGETNIIEYVNNDPAVLQALHTKESCTIDSVPGQDQSGIIPLRTCKVAELPGGCAVRPSTNDETRQNTLGAGFNAGGGGAYAMEWTSEHIKMWFFPRNAIPASITAKQPNSAEFGMPISYFKGANCDIEQQFKNHRFIFNTGFCGDWAGGTYDTTTCPQDPSGYEKPTSIEACVAYVADHPEAFAESYWLINSLNFYKSNEKRDGGYGDGGYGDGGYGDGGYGGGGDDPSPSSTPAAPEPAPSSSVVPPPPEAYSSTPSDASIPTPTPSDVNEEEDGGYGDGGYGAGPSSTPAAELPASSVIATPTPSDGGYGDGGDDYDGPSDEDVSTVAPAPSSIPAAVSTAPGDGGYGDGGYGGPSSTPTPEASSVLSLPEESVPAPTGYESSTVVETPSEVPSSPVVSTPEASAPAPSDYIPPTFVESSVSSDVVSTPEASVPLPSDYESPTAVETPSAVPSSPVVSTPEASAPLPSDYVPPTFIESAALSSVLPSGITAAPEPTGSYESSVASSSRTTITTTITTTYVDVCPTGYTTLTVTQTVTYCPDDLTTPNAPPPGFTTKVTVCDQCTTVPTEVTLLVPTAVNTPTEAPPTPSGGYESPSGAAPSEPAGSEPAPSEPAPSEPAASEPAPTEPTPTEPAPTEPAPSEPAPSEPAASEPAPTKPAASEPAVVTSFSSVPENTPVPTSTRTTITTTITTSYVDVCPTGYTTSVITQTVTYCPDDHTTPGAPPPGFTVTETVCEQGCAPTPTTVTLTVPTVQASPTTSVPIESSVVAPAPSSNVAIPSETVVVPIPVTTAMPSDVDYTTSTIFSTSIVTFISCASSVVDCPAHSDHSTVFQTTVISVGVTVCPITSTVPEPTSVPEPGNPPPFTFAPTTAVHPTEGPAPSETPGSPPPPPVDYSSPPPPPAEETTVVQPTEGPVPSETPIPPPPPPTEDTTIIETTIHTTAQTTLVVTVPRPTSTPPAGPPPADNPPAPSSNPPPDAPPAPTTPLPPPPPTTDIPPPPPNGPPAPSSNTPPTTDSPPPPPVSSCISMPNGYGSPGAPLCGTALVPSTHVTSTRVPSPTNPAPPVFTGAAANVDVGMALVAGVVCAVLAFVV